MCRRRLGALAQRPEGDLRQMRLNWFEPLTHFHKLQKAGVNKATQTHCSFRFCPHRRDRTSKHHRTTNISTVIISRLTHTSTWAFHQRPPHPPFPIFIPKLKNPFPPPLPIAPALFPDPIMKKNPFPSFPPLSLPPPSPSLEERPSLPTK